MTSTSIAVHGWLDHSKSLALVAQYNLQLLLEFLIEVTCTWKCAMHTFLCISWEKRKLGVNNKGTCILCMLGI